MNAHLNRDFTFYELFAWSEERMFGRFDAIKYLDHTYPFEDWPLQYPGLNFPHFWSPNPGGGIFNFGVVDQNWEFVCWNF